jgi:uncharacterized protein (DUF2235 family)
MINSNFEKTVQAAYRWLSDNYEDGDTIFLFGQSERLFRWPYRSSPAIGFSRGAFQVRALSAMIEKVHKPFNLVNLALNKESDWPHSQGERDADSVVRTFKESSNNSWLLIGGFAFLPFQCI